MKTKGGLRIAAGRFASFTDELQGLVHNLAQFKRCFQFMSGVKSGVAVRSGRKPCRVVVCSLDEFV